MFMHYPLVKQALRPQSALLAAITSFVIGLSATTAFAAAPASAPPGTTNATQQVDGYSQKDRHSKLVGYLPDYDGSYADFCSNHRLLQDDAPLPRLWPAALL
jgi:hypothetical protein